MGNAISTAAEMICDCCQRLKMCKMYIIATLEAAWVCDDCRFPKKK